MQAAIRFCCLAGLITLLAGCSKDNSSDPVLTLSTQNISLTGTILREQMEITTDAAWSISHDDAPWITVAPAEGPAGLVEFVMVPSAEEGTAPEAGQTMAEGEIPYIPDVPETEESERETAQLESVSEQTPAHDPVPEGPLPERSGE